MNRPVPLRFEGRPVDASIAVRGRTVVLERGGALHEGRLMREGPWIEIAMGERVVRAATARDARGIWIAIEGRSYRFEVEHRSRADADAPDAGGEIRAPMTGRVASVEAKASARVREGDLLITIEAMKMEFKLTAPSEGVVAEVLCVSGDLVELGQLLARLTLDAKAPA